MILGAKSIWSCIMNLEKTGRGFIGMRVTLKSLLRIMQTMSLLKMMMEISPLTGFPSFFFSFPAKACSFCLEKMLLLNFAFICMSLITEVVVLLKNYSNKYSLKILLSLFFISYILLWCWSFFSKKVVLLAICQLGNKPSLH